MDKTKEQLVEELGQLRRRVTDLELGGIRFGDRGENSLEDGSEGSLRTVKIPDRFREVFLRAQDYVRRYFDNSACDPESGTIEISGERYILVRAASMSTEFFDLVTSLYQDRGEEEAQKVAKGFLFDIAHALGKADAREFHKKMDVSNPIEKLSAGPVHFAYAGWAFVAISPESRPSPDDDYFLIYDHPFAFEADAWLKHERKADFPVCIMNAGYSSGWCEESFGIPLVAVEVECRAMGDEHCRFIMAPPSRIEQYIEKYGKKSSVLAQQSSLSDIPEFFQRKRLEDALKSSHSELERRVQERTTELQKINRQLEIEVEERKSAEKALEAEKERLMVTLGSIGDGVIATDRNGNITLMNSVAGELTGWSPEDALSRSLDAVFMIESEQTGERPAASFEQMIHHGETVALPVRTVLVSKDGTKRIIADSGARIHDSSGRIIGMVLVFRDITEKLKTEEELQKGQKLESLGILAGGIAHDFNNILQSVLGDISLAKIHIDHTGRAFVLMDRAEKATLQATGLTQQLLTFSKGGAPIKETASIAEIVKSTTEFALRGTNIGLQISVPDDLWPVDVDRAQMSQVVGNLIINAVQAMSGGGIIQVAARNVRLEEASGLPLTEGIYVCVSITDQGVGIPAELLPKIFDPYFTTKETGSGLGLSVTYSVVKNHGGHVVVDSVVGRGTMFSIYLPASKKHIAEREGYLEDKRTTQGERILVMDDEESVLETVSDILHELGYEAITATDGDKAIRLFNQASAESQPFDAIIMDLTVPGGMGGLEATRRLKEIDPDLRAIVTSGYSTDPVLADHEKYGFHGVLVKPFRIDQLACVLRAVLSG